MRAPVVPTPPFVAIMPSPSGYVSYFDSFGAAGVADASFVLIVDAGARTIDAQIALDAYLGSGGARSIFDAIVADRTLGGVVQDCTPLRADGPSFESGLIARIPLNVYARKG